jgi:hypothetical protein
VTGPIDPRAIVKAATVKAEVIPESTYIPPGTANDPDPDPVTVPARTVIAPLLAELPDILKSPDGESYSLNDSVGMLWALLQSLQIRTVTGHVTLTAVPGGVGGTIWAAGASFEKPIVWDAAAPETPTGVLVSAEAGILSAGKTVATLKAGTATTTGATLVCKNVSGGNVIVNASNPITYNAQAMYLYTPPLETL